MARSRNIKPGFFKNDLLADLGPLAQLLFAGLWCLADREGRLKDRPRFIKAEIFPYYDCDVNGELTELERLGFVARYSAGGEDCIEIKNFKKHQSPHNTEKPSELPDPPAENGANPDVARPTGVNGYLTVNSRKDNDGNPPDSLCTDSLCTDSLIPELAPAAKPPARKTQKHGMPIGFDLNPSDRVAAWAVESQFTEKRLLDNFAKFVLYARREGKKYSDWDAALMTAIRDDWAKVGEQKQDRHGGFASRDYSEGVRDDGRF